MFADSCCVLNKIRLQLLTEWLIKGPFIAWLLYENVTTGVAKSTKTGIFLQKWNSNRKCGTHRAKKSFSLIPEMQATMLSINIMLPNHTCIGFKNLRSAIWVQGRRKPIIPNTHWMGGHRQKEHKIINNQHSIMSHKKRNNWLWSDSDSVCKVVYLCGEKSCGSDSNPAVQGVHVGNVVGVVKVKHGTNPHDWQDEREKHHCSMRQLPGEFIMTPAQRNAVQHSSCRGRQKQKRCWIYFKVYQLLCLNSGSTSFEGESFRETSLTSSAVVKCDGLAFGAFPGCVTRCFTLTSRFLPPRKVTIYAARCQHFLSVFLLFPALLGYVWPRKDRSGASSKKWGKKEHLEEPSRGVVT